MSTNHEQGQFRDFRGYSLDILTADSHTAIHSSEHYTHEDAISVLPALGYPHESRVLTTIHDYSEFYTLRGHDHLYVRIERLYGRPPKVVNDFVVTVRITGTRDGWSRTILDTPKFVLMSHPTSGGMYTWATAHAVAREMFAGLMTDADTMHITVHALEK